MRFKRRRRVTAPRSSVWQLFRQMSRVLPFVRPHRRLALTSMSMIGFSALLGLAGPWPLAIVIDTITGRRHLPGILRSLWQGLSAGEIIAITVVAGLALNVLAQGLTVLDSYINTKLNVRLNYDFSSAAYAHVQRLSLGFHDREAVGRMMYRLSQQTSSLGQIVVTVPPIVQSLLTAFGMLTVALFLDWQLALLAAVMIPLVMYSTRYYARRILPRLYDVRQLEMTSQSIMYEGLAMIRVIMAFGRERDQVARWREQAWRANEARISVTLRQTLFGVAVALITGIGTALVLGIGAAAVLDHRLNVGELVVLLGYVGSIYQPVQQLSSTFGSLQQQLVNLESALEVLDLEPAVTDAPDARELTTVAGALTFDHVNFTYGGGEGGAASRGASSLSRSPRAMELLSDPHLDGVRELARELGVDPERRLADDSATLIDVSFRAQAGQHVAIIGPTGAGKTTILSLMMRFYDPDQGAVLLDGVDLRQLKLQSLREQVALVLQEPMLFAGSIGENILYGKPDSGPAQVVEAARAANAHDFISSLPDGYDTLIGERGSQISQGERQRISIARAFLKDAPILLLDEPTSSIDAQTEAGILAALERLMAGRTTFTVAHRLSTVRRADHILVVDQGRVVQQGTHAELAAQDGLYKQLHDLQFGTASFDDLSESTGQSGGGPDLRAALMTADMMIAAVAILCQDRAVEPLVALVQRLPLLLRGSHAWLLIGASLAAVRDRSDGPLRELAAQNRHPDLRMRGVARFARELLSNHDALDAAARLGANGARPDPLDERLLLRAPWRELAQVDPAAVRALAKVLPTKPSWDADHLAFGSADRPGVRSEA
jgi:ATP-binding cassette, subfamily B, bacterial